MESIKNRSICEKPISRNGLQGDTHSIKRVFIAVFVAAVVLCLGAFLNGGPMIFADTRAYYVGGHMAIEKVASILANVFSTAGDASQSIGENGANIRNAVGVRSAYYGIFVYALNALGTLWSVIFVQAFIVAYVIHQFWQTLFGRVSPFHFIVAITFLSVFSSVSWFSSYVMPDVFTGVAILATILLSMFPDRLDTFDVVALVLILAFGIAAHNSHLLLVVALSLVVLAARTAMVTAPRQLARAASLLVVPTAFAVIAGLAVGIVGFKQLTLSPQRPPFLMARSIEDGPGRLYLQQHCATLDYEVCKHVHNLPDTAWKVLWEPGGVFMGSDPEARDRLRNEEMRIVAAAALDYPLLQISASLQNWLRQLAMFGYDDLPIGNTGKPTTDNLTEVKALRGTLADRLLPLLGYLTTISYVTVAGSLAILVMYLKTGLGLDRDRRLTAAIALVIGGVVLNAAICGILSDPFPRYQARVIWLIPFLTLPIMLKASSEFRGGDRGSNS